MGPGDLAHVLRHLTSKERPPELLVGLHVADDAAVWQVDQERALVQTVDFFTPVVDDPYTYGAIAAANSLSDVYAMGGEPFLALAIAAFPADLPKDILAEIFRGGADKAAEAGVVIAGGHTVTDDEPKYGLCATGLVHPDRVLTKAAARPGDAVYLTKPLGTGVITTALKKERATAVHVDAAVEWMLRLNRDAARILARFPQVRACTDITGFGLPPRLRDGGGQRRLPGDRGGGGAVHGRRARVRRRRPAARRRRPQPGVPGGTGCLRPAAGHQRGRNTSRSRRAAFRPADQRRPALCRPCGRNRRARISLRREPPASLVHRPVRRRPRRAGGLSEMMAAASPAVTSHRPSFLPFRRRRNPRSAGP